MLLGGVVWRGVGQGRVADVDPFGLKLLESPVVDVELVVVFVVGVPGPEG